MQTDTDGHKAAFSTYACRLIRNEIYDALEYSTRRGLELATDPNDLPCIELKDDPEDCAICSELLDRLTRAEAVATGTAAKGFQAIRLLIQGYSSREIGERSAYRPTM